MDPLDFPPRETARLVLRLLVPQDVDALFALHADPEAMRYWSFPPWKDVAEAHAALARDETWRLAGSALRVGVTMKSEGRLIGTCSLFNLHRTNRRAEIGYLLARDCWGQGLMQEALRALLDFAFDDLGLNRLEADIDPRNAASARILERLGFMREGLLRERWIVDGEVSDSALYGLIARDRP